MITKLILENFQSHKHTEIDFSNGVNMVIGPTDCGKSAIIRALRWVLKNEPLGDFFRSDWGGGTRVAIHLDDGNVVTRVRTNTSNEYHLNDESFAAFKGVIPEEITKVLNVADVNFQFQLDAPYLFSKTAGEVAGHFNQIAKLDEIDQSIKRVTRWTEEHRRAVLAKEQDIAVTTTKLEGLQYLDKLESEVEVVESMQQTFQQAASRTQKLKTLIAKIGRIEEDLNQYQPILKLEILVGKTRQLYNTYKEQANTRNKLKSLIYKYERTEQAIQQANIVVAREKQVDDVLALFTRKSQVQPSISRLKQIISRYNNLLTDLTDKKQDLLDLEEQYAEGFPDECPLCGSDKKYHKH